jgi:hypothetical protein
MKTLLMPLVQKQSYLNLIYIITGFVLSNIYLVLFTTGFSLAFGLTFILIGIPLIILCLYGVRQAGELEIGIANSLLGTTMPHQGVQLPSENWLEWIKQLISDDRVWRRMVYFILKYLVDMVMFVVAISLVGTSIQLVFIPWIAQQNWISGSVVSAWYNQYHFPVIYTSAGLVLFLISLHVINIMADFYRKFTGYFLTDQNSTKAYNQLEVGNSGC